MTNPQAATPLTNAVIARREQMGLHGWNDLEKLARGLERSNTELRAALEAFVTAEEAFKREAFDAETMDDALGDAYKLAKAALSTAQGE